MKDRFLNVKIEAANRAEATALLIRCGYKVYRPEVDADGEDLVVRAPSGELRAVQLKGHAAVDRHRYGRGSIWMLFPSAQYTPSNPRQWFMIPHKTLYRWIWRRHGHTEMRMTGRYDIPNKLNLPKALRSFLTEWELKART